MFFYKVNTKQKMNKIRPLISNQYGALVMAFIPFLYGIMASHFVYQHLLLGFAWLFLYLFSYPFFALFSAKKQKTIYWRWAIIYGVLSALCALPLLVTMPRLGYFFLALLPLFAIEIYFAKKRNERHLVNDMAGIITFGIIGMVSFYLAQQQVSFAILVHPTLFFLCTTLYVKSILRERKNPRYKQASILLHFIIGVGYAMLSLYSLALVYLCTLIRAILVPRFRLNPKQVGLIEFVITAIFLIGLYWI